MGFRQTLDAIFRVKELLAKETELKAIKGMLNNIKPQAGMPTEDMENTFGGEPRKLVEFNNTNNGTASFLFNFKKVTDHSHINTDGVVFARISDERLDLSHATVIRLDMVQGVVVAQSIKLSGAYFPHDFIGLSTLELMRWSGEGNYLESRQLANGKEDTSKKYAVMSK
jgi:hypothetical protein